MTDISVMLYEIVLVSSFRNDSWYGSQELTCTPASRVATSVVANPEALNVSATLVLASARRRVRIELPHSRDKQDRKAEKTDVIHFRQVQPKGIHH